MVSPGGSTQVRGIDAPNSYEDYQSAYTQLLEEVDHGLVVVENGTSHRGSADVHFDTSSDELQVNGSSIEDIIDGDDLGLNTHIINQSGSSQMTGDVDMGGNDLDDVGDLEVNGTLTIPEA